jgi:hypothetical protein
LGNGKFQEMMIQRLVGHPSTMSRGCDSRFPRPFSR